MSSSGTPPAKAGRTSDKMTRLRSFCIALALMLMAAHPARAEGDSRKAAGEHYQRGLELANRGDYKTALEEFDQAYALSPNFAVLYNIGQADMALGRPQKAMAALERYLADGGERVPADRRADVERQIALLESSFAKLEITTEPPGARVTVDGADAGTTPLAEPVKLAAGTHVISASRPGAATASQVVTLVEGQRESVSLALTNAPVAAVPAGGAAGTAPSGDETKLAATGAAGTKPDGASGSKSGAVAPQQGADRASSPFPTGYVLIGAGVALGGVTVAQYLWNHGRVEDFRANEADLATDTSPGRAERQAANNDLADSIHRGSVVTVVLGAMSGALVAAGVVLVVTDHRSVAANERASARSLTVEVPSVAVTRDSFALSWRGRW
jgi:hypothetical protein